MSDAGARTVVAVAALMAAVGVGISAPSAHAYGSGSDYDTIARVWKSPDPPNNVVPTWSWTMSDVHGTDDWLGGPSSLSQDYYSFRTSSWTGTSRAYYYRCSGPRTSSSWSNQLVSDSSGNRDYNGFTPAMCDNVRRRIYWDQNPNESSSGVHWHLHTQYVDGPCGDNPATCPLYVSLSSWYVRVDP